MPTAASTQTPAPFHGMFLANVTYAVVLDRTMYALVSGTTAAAMVAAGSLATFIPQP